jgi:hypothetical protein
MAEDKKPLKKPLINEKSSEMDSLIKSLKASTESNKAESETVDMQMFLDQFKDSMKVGDTNIKALKVEFEKANEILNNQSSEATEKEEAQKTIDAIKESVESEEEKREKQKAQDEANSILNKMAGKLDSVAKGLDGFVSNAIGAGGLLAAAMLFIDPEKFFNILSGLFDAAIKIIGKISAFFKDKILPKLGQVEGEVDYTSVLIGSLALFFSGTIIRALSSTVKVMKTLVTAVKTFATFIKTSFVGNMISNLATTTKNFMSAGITKVKNAAIAFKAKMLTEFIPNMLANLKSMMVSLGGKVMTLMNNLVKAAKGFRIMMLTTFIPGMIAAFTGIAATLATVLAPLAPILLPILAIAATFGLLLAGLNKIKESLGFTSIFDVIEYGLAHVKDGLARFGNFFIKIAKKIADLASGVLEMFGFEVPNFITDLSNAQMLSTDNADRKRVELDQKAETARLEKQKEEQLENPLPETSLIPQEIMPMQPNLQSDVLATSQENAQGQSAITTQTVVNSVTQQNSSSSSSSSSTVVNPTGNSMAAMELAGATGGRR